MVTRGTAAIVALCGVLLLGSCTAPPPPTPTATIDQQLTSSSPNGGVDLQWVCQFNVTSAPRAWGQTFTAGRTGQITQVSLVAERTGNPQPMQVSIQALTAGVPNGTVLGSGSYSGAGSVNNSTFIEVPLSGNPVLTAGVQYAIVMEVGGCTSPLTFDYWLLSGVASLTDPYTGGTLLGRTNGIWGAETSSTKTDFLFRTWTR